MNCRLLGRGFAIYPYQRAQDPILAHLGDCNRWAVHSEKAHQAEPKVCSPWDATRPKGPPRCPHRCEFCLTNYGEDTETAVRRTGSTCMGAAARARARSEARRSERTSKADGVPTAASVSAARPAYPFPTTSPTRATCRALAISLSSSGASPPAAATILVNKKKKASNSKTFHLTISKPFKSKISFELTNLEPFKSKSKFSTKKKTWFQLGLPPFNWEISFQF